MENTNKFSAVLQLIGINPYVLVPEAILNNIFVQAQKNKGSIPVCGFINEVPYTQTLVKYKGEWRLYINLKMLVNSPRRIGETISVTIQWDNKDRTIKMLPQFETALKNDLEAHRIFESLTPSLQKEIIRYLSSLKKEETVNRNIALAIGFLKGENRFVARDPIKE